ncbi:phage tail tape measure protein [Cytobacillus gottheilii]|uniref:phage tail tape measure protein n=1 Tax=Cytobacillus gottheilii TaxID=859144 RepID=UPI0009B9C085|nr:phage tail tape measure protein [Cytobacillus gottheilii]
MSIIGNSLKSIYSRLTSIQPAIDGLAEIGVNVKNSAGEMIRVEEILTNLSSKWSYLSKEQQQNLGLQIAGENFICQPNWKQLENNGVYR